MPFGCGGVIRALVSSSCVQLEDIASWCLKSDLEPQELRDPRDSTGNSSTMGSSPRNVQNMSRVGWWFGGNQGRTLIWACRWLQHGPCFRASASIPSHLETFPIFPDTETSLQPLLIQGSSPSASTGLPLSFSLFHKGATRRSTSPWPSVWCWRSMVYPLFRQSVFWKSVACGGFHSHGGTPKWLVCDGKSNSSGWFRCTPISGNPYVRNEIGLEESVAQGGQQFIHGATLVDDGRFNVHQAATQCVFFVGFIQVAFKKHHNFNVSSVAGRKHLSYLSAYICIYVQICNSHRPILYITYLSLLSKLASWKFIVIALESISHWSGIDRFPQPPSRSLSPCQWPQDFSGNGCL